VELGNYFSGLFRHDPSAIRNLYQCCICLQLNFSLILQFRPVSCYQQPYVTNQHQEKTGLPYIRSCNFLLCYIYIVVGFTVIFFSFAIINTVHIYNYSCINISDYRINLLNFKFQIYNI